MKCQRNNCNVEFEPKSHKQKYCSKECLRNADTGNNSRYNIIENENGEIIFNVDLYLKSVATI
jgi:hypothetical protein